MKKIIVKNKATKTVIVIPKTKMEKSEHSEDSYEIGLVNFITGLLEKDYVEKALTLINLFFEKMTTIEKGRLSLNIIEATKQYKIPVDLLPESYFDFLTSRESDPFFMT